MIHVACAADETYAPHCAAMLHSLLQHNEPARTHVHFLHEPGLAPQVRERLAAMVRARGATITLHAIDDARCAGLPSLPRIPSLMWYRVLLPELLPAVDRVLYLDADTLVCASVAPLWDLDLAGCTVAAVDNVLDPDQLDRPARLGLPPAQQYFNSGVLLMNLAEQRRLDSAAAVLDYGRRHGAALVWPDQDALNAVLGARRHALHPRWNCQNTLYYFFDRSRAVFGAAAVREAVRAPAIVHFEGPALAKPWHYLCKHPERARYWRHRAATPWPGGTPDERTWPNRLLRLLPMAWLPRAYRAMDRWKARAAT